MPQERENAAERRQRRQNEQEKEQEYNGFYVWIHVLILVSIQSAFIFRD